MKVSISVFRAVTPQPHTFTAFYYAWPLASTFRLQLIHLLLRFLMWSALPPLCANCQVMNAHTLNSPFYLLLPPITEWVYGSGCVQNCQSFC